MVLTRGWEWCCLLACLLNTYSFTSVPGIREASLARLLTSSLPHNATNVCCLTRSIHSFVRFVRREALGLNELYRVTSHDQDILQAPFTDGYAYRSYRR